MEFKGLTIGVKNGSYYVILRAKKKTGERVYLYCEGSSPQDAMLGAYKMVEGRFAARYWNKDKYST